MTATSTYQDRIISDPGILGGKPVIKGTRISVQLILEHLADDPSTDELFAAYPDLTLDDVKAALAYAGDLVDGIEVTPAPRRRPQAGASRSSACARSWP
jgi:uncharacterized protein (DUF433 family)